MVRRAPHRAGTTGKLLFPGPVWHKLIYTFGPETFRGTVPCGKFMALRRKIWCPAPRRSQMLPAYISGGLLRDRQRSRSEPLFATEKKLTSSRHLRPCPHARAIALAGH